MLSIATKVTAPAKGGVTVTASGIVKIKGVKKAIKLADHDREARRRSDA